MKGILKWPLIIAAIVTVARVVAERAGAPAAFSNALSVAVLHTLIVPIYLAVKIGGNIEQRPYMTLFKFVAIYAVLTRAMIIPTYWLARVFEWPENRFAGLWGPDVSAVTGFIVVPFATAAFWIVASLVIGTGIGAIVAAVTRSRSKGTRAAG